MGQKVITVAQQKGGAGKTTVAVHLAVALSQRGFRVGVIDVDPQGSLTHWHRIREERFGEDYTGLQFAAVSGWRVGTEVTRMKRHCDFVIIDSPPHVETEARTAIRQADLLLVPVQPSPTDLWATKAVLSLSKAENVPARIILNRVNNKSRIVEMIEKELTGVLTKTRLANRVIFASSIMEGRGVTEAEPNSPAALEIKALVKEVIAFFPKEVEATTNAKMEMA
ncbi:MAG: ParA family protein [Rickettsiales bacterium]|nr:ParA family protein [Rickettsiales bacterium]